MKDFKESNPLYGLGIDAGGTFTDIALVDINNATIIAHAKAPTTLPSPIGGIRQALKSVPQEMLQQANFVSLATTFATNAIVEGKGSKAALVLIGYSADHPALSKISPTVFLTGGHNYWGEELAPLDLEPLERQLRGLVEEVDAIAVSGYFSVRNAEHEKQVINYIQKYCKLPLVAGHQLSTRLNAPKRAVTAWWNARLIPLIHDLIEDTRHVLNELGLNAPLLVVRGDGTLMSFKEAENRPVETILSGPAASIYGAKFLTGQNDGLVVDMGGTTTDMAILKDGRVEIDSEGAQVGGWQTHVQAAKLRTTGLGGDSIVWSEDATLDGLRVGPQRVEPLCKTAQMFPEITAFLREFNGRRGKISLALYNPCTFYVIRKDVSGLPGNLSRQLFQSPINEYHLLSNPGFNVSKLQLRELENRGLIVRTSLTPTDFCVARGSYDYGSREAAKAAVSLLANLLSVDEPRLYKALEDEIARRLVIEAVNLCFRQQAPALLSLMDLWYGKIFSQHNSESIMDISVNLDVPVLAIGAPAKAWIPNSFKRLQASCLLPEHFM
ncbi:MAG: hypothetical protein DRH15_10880, partial [Deltaproteobacteria bacterium]